MLRPTTIEGNGYRGRIYVDGTADSGPPFRTPAGLYEGALYGPEAVETAGQWWLIEAYPADHEDDGEMVVVGAFGARKNP